MPGPDDNDLLGPDDPTRDLDRFDDGMEGITGIIPIRAHKNEVTLVSYLMEDLPTHAPLKRPIAEIIEDLSAPVRIELPSERYEMLEVLGTGGTGEVVRALDTKLNRIVAYKVLLPELAGHHEMIARFIHEAQIVARLEHPAIVPVHELAQDASGCWFLTMKEIQGRTLRHFIRDVHASVTDGRFVPTHDGWTLRRLVDVFRTVCAAMQFAHSRAVIHRDLKPDNIMVGEYGEVIVVDWGLAVQVAATHPSYTAFPRSGHAREESPMAASAWVPRQQDPLGEGIVVGTPAYMPPEQARADSKSLGPWSDVWALGAILYSILYGRAPYVGETEDILEQVQRHPPRHVDGYPVAESLIEVWRKAMSLDHRQRYVHAGELVTEIDAWLEGSKARDKAMGVIEAARQRMPALREAQARAAQTREKARAAVIALRPTDPLRTKEDAWRTEEEAERLQVVVDDIYLEVNNAAQIALAQVPDLPEAHDLLAELYLERAQAAEAAGDRKAAREYRTLLAAHDDGTYADYLISDARITLDTVPRGAQVHIRRFQHAARRLVARRVATTGPTPLRGLVLPMGSYTLEFRMKGRAPVRYPLFLGRGQEWSANPPGSDKAVPVLLPPSGALQLGECLVSAGWFRFAGDPEAINPLPLQRVWVDAFAIQEHPVTHRQYLAFLNDLARAGHGDAAHRHAPRFLSKERGVPDEQLYKWTQAPGFDATKGTWTLQERVRELRMELDAPVVLVSWYDAQAYCRWLALKSGLPWRLPAEYEREKAARGTDGRTYPWGHYSDPAFHCIQDSPMVFQGPMGVGSFPVDTSPYGVQGLAGGVQEWCADPFKAHGPRRNNGSAVIPDPPQAKDLSPSRHAERRPIRGGAWNLPAQNGRVASRQGSVATRRAENLGFRLCRTVP